MKKVFAKLYIWILLVILYAPLVFIAVFSFTEAKALGNWTGFSPRLYQSLFTGGMQGGSGLMKAVENTLVIAIISAAVATLLGTIAAIGIHNLKGRKKQAIMFMNNIPMINPDIIIGVSLFLLFVFLRIRLRKQPQCTRNTICKDALRAFRHQTHSYQPWFHAPVFQE